VPDLRLLFELCGFLLAVTSLVVGTPLPRGGYFGSKIL